MVDAADLKTELTLAAGWPKPDKEEVPVDLNQNLEKAIAERKAGANKVLARIIDETGIDKDKLRWVGSLKEEEPKYHLHVDANNDQRVFDFSNEELSDYPEGRPDTDAKVDEIVRWIKARRP